MSPKNTTPLPFVYTGTEIIRGIPNKYLRTACHVVAFVFFRAGATAFDQSPFYGGLFIVIAIVLFFAGVYVGKAYRSIE